MEIDYLKFDEELFRQLMQAGELMKLFNYLLTRLGGDAEEALQMMRRLQEEGYLPENFDLQGFRDALNEQNIVSQTPNGAELSAKGEKNLRQAAFEEIFQKMKISGPGSHSLPYQGGAGDEMLPEKRKYIFGDDMKAIDMSGSLLNSVTRSGNFDLEMEESDLLVHESERSTGCATVLMIDISHSMILYGEDRITPAKQVALAFTHLILTKYPKDDLSVVLFGDDAFEVEISEVPYINVGPYHTNTQMGLRLARNILLKKRQTNKQILMITDGKPSMIKEPDGSFYRNTVGLDPKIVAKTLDEAALCRKKNIAITTFMVTDDSYLQDFIKRLTEINQGRAFFSSIDNLGEFMMWNFVTNRKR
jgi:uncharacterized protein with von Willebrand factor type A (vWA) domain